MSGGPRQAATAEPALELALADTRVAVTSDERSDNDWLEEFLCPPFVSRRGIASAEALHVALRVDADACAELAAADWEAAPRLPVFALDAGAVEMPARRDRDGGRLLRDDTFRVFYRIAPDGRRVDLVAGKVDVRTRTPLLRVVRELLMGRIYARGWPMLHASAIEREGRVVAFLGATAAGKTSLLLHALGVPGARMLGNDRVVVRDDGAGLSLFGLPTILTLRESALAYFPAVAAALAASRYSHRLTVAESARAGTAAPRAGSNGKFGVTPAQLCLLTGVERAAGGAPAAIVLPRHSGRPGGFALRRLDEELARQELREAQFSHGAWMRPTALFKPAGVDDDAVLAWRARILDRLAASTPVFVAELGTDAYADPAGVPQLSALLEAAP